jgi:hypothetical protein
LPTVNDLVTDVAAGYVPLPACDATSVQVPTEIAVTDSDEIVQTAVVELLSETVKPLEAETYDERSKTVP